MDDLGDTDWLVGEGELFELVRSRDWSQSPLGPREQWPQVLRSMLGVVLGSPTPMALVWGSDGLLFFNEAYRVVVAGHPPPPLGSATRTQPHTLWRHDDSLHAKVMERGETVTAESAAPHLTLGFTPVRDDHGRIAGMLVTEASTDRHDTALRERTALLQAISDGSTDAIFAKDRNGTFLYANPATLAILGRPLDAVIGKTDADLFTDAGVARRVMDNDRLVMEGEVPIDLEENVPLPDGALRTWHSRKAPYRDQEGHVAGLLGISRDITERKRAQDEVRLAREKLQATLDSITDGLLVMDRDWRYTYFSERAAALVGVRAEDMIGGRVWDLFPHAEGTKFHEGYHRAVDTGRPVEFEEYYPAPIDKWLECRCYPTDEGLSVYFRDVTERRQYEQALRDSEERLRAAIKSLTVERGKLEAIIRALPVGVVITETDGTVISMNDAALRLHGFETADQMLAHLDAYRDSFELRDARDRPLPHDEWPAAKAIRGEYVSGYEVRLRNLPLRLERTVSYSAVPVRDDTGQPMLHVYLMLDVTEHRQRETELRESKERLELLARATAVFMEAKLDAKALVERLVGELVPAHADSAVALLLSKDRLGVDVAAVRHARRDAEEELVGILSRGLPRGTNLSVETLELGAPQLFLHFDQRALEESASPELRAYLARNPVGSLLSIPLRTARGVLGALRLGRSPDAPPFTAADQALLQDVADRAALALDAALRFSEAEQAIRLRDDFLSIASHELRTPLTALQLQLQSMQHLLSNDAGVNADGGARFVRKLESSNRQTARLVSLVDDLLDVSRLSAGKLQLRREELDLGELARDVVDRHASHASASGCALKLEATSVRGEWDRLRIEQVLTNLVANAIKYGPGEPIEVVVGASGGVARLSVRDRGIGIEAPDLARIFGRFERAVSGRHYGGLGLGLYISKQIVEAHGGVISAESQAGKGSAFHVSLPTKGAGT